MAERITKKLKEYKIPGKYVELEMGMLEGLPPAEMEHCPPDETIFNVIQKVTLTPQELDSLQASIDAKSAQGVVPCGGHPDADDPQHFQIAHYLEHEVADRLHLYSKIKEIPGPGVAIANTILYDWKGRQQSGYFFRKGVSTKEDQIELSKQALRVLNEHLSYGR